ncbi:glycerate kinase [Acuticoccus mangrovi]|uniref:Glycerate kinase n=1 Tax=Acuticoccus mangrovi TaxID=2796142 RepID=A0A934IS14_9HYPH|nr:glycerate kinase [Acuticoccus mangrovi]
MKILIACDKFRGSLTAAEANAAIADALAASALDASCLAIAIADGGEGTLAALEGPGSRRLETTVTGPYGKPLEVEWLYDEARRRGVIELAVAAGHGVAAEEGYDPDRASSVGVGELIRAALDEGAREVVIALGGSITVDGGAGALEALGGRFFDDKGAPLARPAGRGLADVARVDLSGLDARVRGLSIVLAADVDNPLIGPRGAARVFGPQKGVAAADIDDFDAALAAFDRAVAAARSADTLANHEFAGAAGGMMVGLSAIADTAARDGFQVVAEHHDLDAAMADVALVVTGEGSLDSQSLGGKGPVAIARAAAASGVPAIAFAGRLAVAAEDLRAHGIVAAFAIGRGPASLEEALAAGADGLHETARNAFDLIAAARRLS